MKIADGKIAEATRDEMFDYYLARDFDDLMPFSEFLRRCEENGTRITDTKEGRREVKKQKIDQLSDWEWTTLVAAWRYYEHGHTIGSAMFPHDIVERFWGDGNPYTDNVRDTIANQFAHIDHGLDGEGDWTRWLKPDNRGCFDCDYSVWTTFYQFCRGWVDGYTELTVSNGKRTEKIKAFYTEFTKKWTPVEGYIKHGQYAPYVPEEYIKEKNTKAKGEARDIDLSNVHAVCFDCARHLGFEQEDKAVGVWTDECGVCHQRKPCTDLHHDWKQINKGETHK